jgi:hypothetical protein
MIAKKGVRELFYKTLQGKEVSWLVNELEPGQRFRIVDAAGNPNPQGVDASKERSSSFIFFDGFSIEGQIVYAVSLITGDPKIEVGHTPHIE